MTKQVDPLKKERYKQARLKGECKAKSLINAGGAVSTAYHDIKDNVLVNTCERELMTEVKAANVTVEWVIEGLASELTAKDSKSSDRIRVRELIGKWLNIFKDANNTQVNVFTKDMMTDLPPLGVVDTKTENVVSDHI